MQFDPRAEDAHGRAFPIDAGILRVAPRQGERLGDGRRRRQSKDLDDGALRERIRHLDRKLAGRDAQARLARSAVGGDP